MRKQSAEAEGQSRKHDEGRAQNHQMQPPMREPGQNGRP